MTSKVMDFQSVKVPTLKEENYRPPYSQQGPRYLDPNLQYMKSQERNLTRSDVTMVEKHPNVYSICLTGGPCAGKTTALADLK
jgi:hypothetical protein